ncbi:carbon-nitrogen hydrolase family protein [Pseudocolwellia sp. AS88]|jgi:predicted amidohydrolase|uniref:carbon-nitrogen hydrolase family protein n=1 Tax=Pseudocolwellia sp. AS88 TaxID=3063958 RepID=UPI0026EB4F82|nr:carbon-nitrogen hydrolase family protein [Pseudocolwellia sp. AS88]MDO7084323.1 carbon-nitrogen hydrolase family protein [Pseudocolwellia sp. AS88]
MVSLSAIQLCSKPNVEHNLATIEAFLKELTPSDENIVVLPECCLFFGGTETDQLNLAKQNSVNNFTADALAALAKKYQLYLVAGSIPILLPDEEQETNNERFTNSSLVFSPSGELIQRYDKIHLFDAKVKDGQKQYLESTHTQAGKKLSVAKTKSTHIGLSICYDLRFPELYRQLRTLGADIITVPSAFTATTGKAHWQALLQARAIENQVYVIAAGQQGIHENGRETWGHSMIISPWGEIKACAPDGEGIITVTYSPEELAKVREAMPVMNHNKFTSKLTPYE